MKTILFYRTISLLFATLLLLSACTAASEPPPTAMPATAVAAKAVQQPTSTAAPTPTVSVPVFTIAEDTPQYTLNAQTLKTNEIPDDVLKELTFSPKGGIMGLVCMDGMETPLEGATQINVLEQVHSNDFVSCGWHEGDTVLSTLTYPDGHAETTTYEISGDPWFGIIAPRGPGTQLGTYELKIEGPDRTASQKFDIVVPDGHGIYSNQGQLLLYGLQPNEHIRAFVYTPGSNWRVSGLMGWYDFRVNAQGSAILTVDLELNGGNIFYVADQTGDLYASLSEISSVRKAHYEEAVADFTCPGAPQTRLYLFQHARTTITDGTSTYLRNRPGKDQEKIDSLAEGSPFLVVDGPGCADGYIWWRIYTPDGKDGWIAEGDAERYYIEPVE